MFKEIPDATKFTFPILFEFLLEPKFPFVFPKLFCKTNVSLFERPFINFSFVLQVFLMGEILFMMLFKECGKPYEILSIIYKFKIGILQ